MAATVVDGAGGDDGGNSGHGSDNSGDGSSGRAGQGCDDDGEFEDNSGRGPNSGPGSGDDDDDGEVRRGRRSWRRRRRSDRGNDPYVRGEIVVADVDETELGVIRGYGFRVLEETRLEALGLTILRLAVPSGWAEDRARAQIAAALPGVIVDVNSLYAMQGQTTLPPPGYGQQMIGWRYAAPGCGRGMKIGMLDTAIEQSLPEFSGARVTSKAWRRMRRRHPMAQRSPQSSSDSLEQVSYRVLFPSGTQYRRGVCRRCGRRAERRCDRPGRWPGLARKAQGRDREYEFGGRTECAGGDRYRPSGERGMLFVAAVGNGGAASMPGFPASLSEVIGVTAIDSGGAIYKNAPRGGEIDFSAPGVRIWGPSGGSAAGRYFSGTVLRGALRHRRGCACDARRSARPARLVEAAWPCRAGPRRCRQGPGLRLGPDRRPIGLRPAQSGKLNRHSRLTYCRRNKRRGLSLSG